MATKGYIRYRSDYKYQLAEAYKISIPIKPKINITTEFIDLDTDGNLTVKNALAQLAEQGPLKPKVRGSIP